MSNAHFALMMIYVIGAAISFGFIGYRIGYKVGIDEPNRTEKR